MSRQGLGRDSVSTVGDGELFRLRIALANLENSSGPRKLTENDPVVTLG